ncbi:hypothetical protein DL96DRAFT_1636052 [Flagelloscypha sp. PMI_526]|nr:hypothetical protein DL96DRAFT_1636052 [Flagelloscypha sp. PMI_526]
MIYTTAVGHPKLNIERSLGEHNSLPGFSSAFPPMDLIAQVDWSDRVLFAGCLIFFYDFVATIPAEWTYFRDKTRYRTRSLQNWPVTMVTVIFMMLRYSALALYMFLTISLGINSWGFEVRFYALHQLSLNFVTRGPFLLFLCIEVDLTRGTRCSSISSTAQILESIFLFSWAFSVWTRLLLVWVFLPYKSCRLIVCLTAPLGLASPIAGIIISTPSVFPECRKWQEEAPSEYAVWAFFNTLATDFIQVYPITAHLESSLRCRCLDCYYRGSWNADI